MILFILKCLLIINIHYWLCRLTKVYTSNNLGGIIIKKIRINAWNEWEQYLRYKEFNWLTLNFITVQYEDDVMCGDREIILVLLGLGIRISWIHKTKKSKELFATLEEELSELKNSFYGWAAKNEIEKLRKKEIPYMVIFRTRKIARNNKFNNTKKLFIQ